MATGGLPLISVVDGLGTMAFPVVPHLIGFVLEPLDHDVRRHLGLVFGIHGLSELDPTLLWGSPEPRSEASEYYDQNGPVFMGPRNQKFECSAATNENQSTGINIA